MHVAGQITMKPYLLGPQAQTPLAYSMKGLVFSTPWESKTSKASDKQDRQ